MIFVLRNNSIVKVNTHHDIPQRYNHRLWQVNPQGPEQHSTDEVWKPADVESQGDEQEFGLYSINGIAFLLRVLTKSDRDNELDILG